MWRAVLLGKLSLFILACFVVGGVCVSHPWRIDGISFSQSAQWIGIGVFFVFLGLSQLAVAFFLTRSKS